MNCSRNHGSELQFKTMIVFSIYQSFGVHLCVSAGSGMPVLDWAKRLKIAIGAAKGLAYLHEDCKYLLYILFLTTHSFQHMIE